MHYIQLVWSQLVFVMTQDLLEVSWYHSLCLVPANSLLGLLSLGSTLFWDHVSFLSKFTKELLKLLAHPLVWTLLRLIDISELPFLCSPTSEEFIIFIIIRRFYYKHNYVEPYCWEQRTALIVEPVLFSHCWCSKLPQM